VIFIFLVFYHMHIIIRKAGVGVIEWNIGQRDANVEFRSLIGYTNRCFGVDIIIHVSRGGELARFPRPLPAQSGASL
jgi:hypothetical protein